MSLHWKYLKFWKSGEARFSTLPKSPGNPKPESGGISSMVINLEGRRKIWEGRVEMGKQVNLLPIYI